MSKEGNDFSKAQKKDVFPETMSEKQIEADVREAYQNGSRIKTQSDPESTRVLVEGTGGGMTIRMWVNLTERIIETAWPQYKQRARWPHGAANASGQRSAVDHRQHRHTKPCSQWTDHGRDLR
ncbi:EndoU domain-containing protein [Sorangium sp. So ce1151]|uniref:EndoU domain-containing protein n=1 Tax=Sorangium sp. So ce1151 TaxID=3133332 RepID=UPI003F5DC6DA